MQIRIKSRRSQWQDFVSLKKWQNQTVTNKHLKKEQKLEVKRLLKNWRQKESVWPMKLERRRKHWLGYRMGVLWQGLEEDWRGYLASRDQPRRMRGWLLDKKRTSFCGWKSSWRWRMR